ncbi:MAG: AtzE family amidohydrolase [Rhizobiales bacterium]|nr:AtzE family amidohydrolase [Hyphomicrobiales bacterium]
MTDWTRQHGHLIAQAIRAGETTASAVIEAHLLAIARRNAELGAYTEVSTERARAKAAAVDAARARGEALPPLAGVPFAVKNLYDIAGIRTLAGSKINRDHAPARTDATLITRMEAAGAVLLGALNMGEYAYDFTGRNAHDGHSRNPHDRTRMTGGSSGGSGAAAAGGLAAITLGSDTNGSIRVPASLCGLFGLKPTYGSLSRARTFPFVASLDHLGPLARSVRDLALAYDAMSGPDSDDPVCRKDQPAPVVPQIATGLAGLRIGVADGYFQRMGTPEAFEAVDRLAKHLDAKVPVTLAEAHRARAAAFIITMVEGGALHIDRLRSRAGDFDLEVRDRLFAGAMLPGQFYVQAQKFRRWFQSETLKIFDHVDAFLAPATPSTAPLVDQATFTLDGQELPVRANLGIFTQPISFIGLPVVTVPLLATNGLPIGVQVIAAPGREEVALRIAASLEADGMTHCKIGQD